MSKYPLTLIFLIVGLMVAFVMFPKSRYFEWRATHGHPKPQAGASFANRFQDDIQRHQIESFVVSRMFTCFRQVGKGDFCVRTPKHLQHFAQTSVAGDPSLPGEWELYVRNHNYLDGWAHFEPYFDELFQYVIQSINTSKIN